ncbi:hypothetical protein EN858_33385 [Mesorhizobium sp. M4B.F.Ca.ET.215.01.1.1]|nr:hypothetical protein EOA34_25650 [Mesorhizobium sp. M4B.F.Ca.ET.013.02.1.1]RVD33624.1 hypothetical protein EN741_31705 [Mesorhizobium sp. M4B.F.Ca.ET.019.03.1.1]RWF58830.1 MAG: hypothetical protein EOS47_32765 [Mesorhizobium sp.]RWX64671.1 hypothetical protein EN780_20255 [Mesorhizobium sp. M4B.F.Ca.ET.089.01.1.1]TGQ03930.1 hypothetical protein EN858_33385 [Mesorhizobium sp. M4B.F.Ca.ET.215.01.1.1]TGQ24023.1 hypothetical protein EN863_064025 [Mesorhizobium sp. M00.F.Ca.ET.220.01.1.1]TGQ291
MRAGFVQANHFKLRWPRALSERWRRPSPACRHLLPVHGEKDVVTRIFANHPRRRKRAGAAASPFSPSLYGEKCPAGR